jgi:hypothetical protein
MISSRNDAMTATKRPLIGGEFAMPVPFVSFVASLAQGRSAGLGAMVCPPPKIRWNRRA